MGCAGSKQPKPSSKTSSKKPATDTTKTSSNTNKATNLPNQADVNGNKTAKIDVTTDDSKDIDDQIIVDRNLLNTNSSNIYSYVTRIVKLKLVANEVSQNSDENNDTGLNKDAFVNDVSTKSLNFIKNSKCKTYTSLNKALKESKLPNISEKDFVCDSVVEHTKKCVQIIQKNKDNKNFNFNNEIDLLDKQLADELQHKKQLEQKRQQQQENTDQVIHRTGRILSWSDANKIARTLFYRDTLPVIHASTTGRKGYVVYKVQADSSEQPLSDNEIDEILSPKLNSINNNNINNISSNISSSLNNSLSQDQNNLSLSIRSEQTVAVRSSQDAVAIIPDQNVAVKSSEQTLAIIPDQTVTIVPDQSVVVRPEQTVALIPDQTVALIPDQTVAVSSEEGRLDDILKQTLLDDRLHNNHSFKDSYSLNNKNIESAAVIIQSSFRGHQTRESLDSQKPAEHKTEVVAEKAAAVQKTEHKENKEYIEKAAEPVIHSQTTNVIPSVVQEAHSKDIQNEEGSIHDFNNDVQLQRRAKSPHENETLKREEDVNTAATVIQSTFRGYKTRKELEGKGLIHKTHSDSHHSNEGHHLSNLIQETQQIPTSTPTPTTTPNQSPPVRSPVTLSINENDEISKLIELIQPTKSEISNTSIKISTVESSNHSNTQTDIHENDMDQINKAATKIQATFRGYHTRKELDEKIGKKKKKNKAKVKQINSEVKNVPVQQSSESASVTATDDVVQKLLDQIQQSEQQLQPHQPEQPQQPQQIQHTEVIEISVVDIDKAATKIQSTFRGYKTRKDLHITHPLHHSTISSENPVDSSSTVSNANNANVKTSAVATASTNDTNTSSNNNNSDITNDNKVLSKRQKKNRKNKQKQQTSQGNQQTSNNDYINEVNNGENLANEDEDDVRNEAATKIQATFRGFQTRRTLSGSQKKPE